MTTALVSLGCADGALEPERQREDDEQDGLGGDDADFGPEREAALGAGGVRRAAAGRAGIGTST